MPGVRPSVLVALALSAPFSAFAAPPALKVAVIDVRANGTDESAAKTLTEVLVVEVGKVPGVSVVSDAELAGLLSLEQRKQMVGCEEDASCAAEIAGALGVDKVCTGSLGKLDSTQVLTLRLIDVKTAKTERRVLEPLEGGAAKFIGRMPALVAQLFPDRVTASSAPPAAAAAPPPTSSSGSAVSLGGLVLYDPNPMGSTPAPTPSPAPSRAPPPAVQPQQNPLGNAWLWLAAGGLVSVLGASWAVAIAETASPEEMGVPGMVIIVGVALMIASPVVCFTGAFGGGGDGLLPLDSPFAVPDATPDRRVTLITVPAAP